MENQPEVSQQDPTSLPADEAWRAAADEMGTEVVRPHDSPVIVLSRPQDVLDTHRAVAARLAALGGAEAGFARETDRPDGSIAQSITQLSPDIAQKSPDGDSLRDTVNPYCNDLLDCAAALDEEGNHPNIVADIRSAVTAIRAAVSANAGVPRKRNP